MKLTKTQLKQLIKEELQAVLSEMAIENHPGDTLPFRDDEWRHRQLDMFNPDPLTAASQHPGWQEYYQNLQNAGLDPSIAMHDAMAASRKAKNAWVRVKRLQKPYIDAAGGDPEKAYFTFAADAINNMMAGL